MYWLKTRLPLLVLALAAMAGCGSERTAGFSDNAELAFARPAERQEGDFLAYEHTVVVDTSDDALARSFKAVTDACKANTDDQCTVLHAELNHGQFSQASIRMRIEPAGVEALTALAASSGEVVRRSTHVEDLAARITDLDKRTAILTTTRDRLLELEQRGADDIESLIKITTELTRVQAELEEVMGQGAYQRQRVDTDILNVRFVVESGRSFWSPIGSSLSSFGRNLSEGLADTIYAIAYLLPWSILVVFVGYLLRKLWIRSRSS